MIVWAGRAAFVWMALWSGSTPGELSSDDYGATGISQTELQRAQMRVEIEAERSREAERAREQAQERAEEQERIQAALAAARARLPPGAVLAETHCTTCHVPDVLANARHTWLGWRLTVLRMRYLNGAQIPAGDLQHIVEHLTRTQAAEPLRALWEYGTAATVGLLALAAGRSGVQRYRHRDNGTT